MSDLIVHVYNDINIPQRLNDSYVDVTALCQSGGKKLNDYLRLKSTKEFLECFSSITGIPVIDLLEVSPGYGSHTFAHPDLVPDIAKWVSNPCRVWASQTLRKLIEHGHVSLNENLDPIQKRLNELNQIKDLIDRIEEPDTLILQKFNDRVRDLLEPQGVDSTAIATQNDEWSVKDRMEYREIRGYERFESQIGRLAAKKFREVYGKEPLKGKRVFGGKQRPCTIYLGSSVEVLDAAIDEYLAKKLT